MDGPMKLHKVVNRVYRGKTYYRWILMVPPATVKELGWREGEEMRMEARGRVLKVVPASDSGRTGTPGSSKNRE